MGTRSLPYHRSRDIPRRYEEWAARLSVLLACTRQCAACYGMRRCTLALDLRAMLTYDSAFQITLRHVLSRGNRRPGEINSSPRQSGCGRANMVQTALRTVEHCA